MSLPSDDEFSEVNCLAYVAAFSQNMSKAALDVLVRCFKHKYPAHFVTYLLEELGAASDTRPEHQSFKDGKMITNSLPLALFLVGKLSSRESNVDFPKSGKKGIRYEYLEYVRKVHALIMREFNPEKELLEYSYASQVDSDIASRIGPVLGGNTLWPIPLALHIASTEANPLPQYPELEGIKDWRVEACRHAWRNFVDFQENF